ncbi:hypothetical protein L1987_86178 [Smallanthus sonchifolius]|uniref:Uncharacterized protein n=1 Tax=Smallanthus sonchifolius TaxID=185202 RepID=A0ACB8XZD3_9ASTR|nr:hypothetical protein L1987_86178 [Smallanthus sonchifolius]
MAYRRRQGLSRSSTFKEGVRYPPDQDDATTSSAGLPHTASDSRLDSFRTAGALHASFKNRSKGSATYDYGSMRSSNERGGFWGVLARKAKAILEDEIPQQSKSPSSLKPETISVSTHNQKCTGIQVPNQNESSKDLKKMDRPKIRIGLDRLTPSLNQIGDTISNSQENRRRATKNEEKSQEPRMQAAQPQRNPESQLQASRDVAIATAAKVKQLMRELKTVKAELASAEDRCCLLEEENKLLLGAHGKRDHPADDDMIRVQLETLLEEKGRLAHENSVHAHENRYLREIVDFHQLTMQDLMYEDDEGVIEVTLPITPSDASQNMIERIMEATLPKTPPEASQNTVEGSSSSPSRYLDDEE